jgi:YVTN family beta-propeller protein
MRLLPRIAALPLLLLASAAWCAAPLAYITNERAGISVVDLDQLSVVRTIDVGGQGPRGIGVTADGRFLVTANKGTSDISLIDAASGQVVRRVAVGKNVEFVRVVGDLAYVTYEPSGPGGPDDPKKANDKEDDLVPAEIAVVDLAQGKVLRSMKSGRETEGIEFSADGKLMLVANEGENTVTVYDRGAGTVVRKIDVSALGSRPRGIKISPDGKTYAVTLEFSDKVLLIDEGFSIVKSAATKKSPYGVSFDVDGRRLFVAASRASVIQVFDSASLALLGEIPVGARCWHFSLTPDGTRLIAACGKSDTLVVADTHTFQVVKTLAGGKGPWGVVTFPRARGSIDTP